LLGIILATPLAIYLEPVTGMGLLIGIFVGGSCGGAISAIVLRIPGTPIAAATLLDGYPMAQKGRAPEAVGLAVASSATGGLIGGVALVLFAPALARVALQFGPPEFFALGVMGLVTIAIVAREATVKGLISGALGIGISLIGLDPFTSYPRFTFGSMQMTAGINLVAVLLGVFAVSQVFMQISEGKYDVKPDVKVFRAPFSVLWRVLRAPFTLFRSSLIGASIGALPGVGAVVGNFVAYSVSKSYSKRGRYYGTGEPEGVITTESANNACCGGALIPSL
jgi:putative tricarboxylic transport membrane protein